MCECVWRYEHMSAQIMSVKPYLGEQVIIFKELLHGLTETEILVTHLEENCFPWALEKLNI